MKGKALAVALILLGAAFSVVGVIDLPSWVGGAIFVTGIYLLMGAFK
jgi:predicted DNA repair protein MutK